MSSTREIHKSLVASRPQWRTRAEYLGLLNKSPVDLDLIPSASNMNERTYITLRVLRPEREPAQMFPRFSTELTARAQEHLAKDTQFQAYLNHIGNGEGDVEGQEELGRFQLLRDCQLEIENRLPKDPGIIPGSDSPAVPQVETRNPGPSRRSNRAPRPSSDYNSPSSGSIDSRGGLFLVVGSDQTAASAQEGITFQKAKDEQIVNDSVISLLKALTINIDRVECRWSSHRNPFSSVKLGPEGNTKTLTALADGYLEGKSKPGEVFALVEAKAAIRHRLKNPEVLWQEAAEIVAWIMKSSVGSYPECLNKMIPENKDTENASWYVKLDCKDLEIEC